MLEGASEIIYEVIESPDYTMLLETISGQLADIFGKLEELSSVAVYLEGFAVFVIVVALCWFVYRFFRMFF